MALQLVSPPDVRVSQYRQYTFELRWRPERRYVPGTLVELRAAPKKGYLSWRWGRVQADLLDVLWREPDDWQGIRWDNLDQVLMRGRLNYEVWEAHTISIQLTANPGLAAGVDPTLSIWTKDWTSNPDEPFDYEQAPGSEVTLAVRAAPAEYLYLITRPAPEADGRVRAALVPEDRFCNPTAFADPVDVKVHWDGEVVNQKVQGATVFHLPAPSTEQAVLRATAEVDVAALAPDENVINGKLQGARFVVVGSPTWVCPQEALVPAFGAIHWHSEHSGDGIRSIEDGIASARDTLNLDFVSSADHHPTREGWAATVAALQAADDPGTFATLFGWEGASDRGHCNFYFTDPDHRLRPHGEVNLIDEAMKLRKGGDVNENMRPNDYLYELEGDDFLVVPHHTHAGGGKYWRPFPWADPTPMVRLVEIMQGRGNMEFDLGDDAWRSYFQFSGGAVRQALAKGFRFGFNGGTDNHTGRPGRLNRQAHGRAHNVILTGTWVEERTRDAVFGALYDRATWATWGTRAIVDFRINGAPAGSDLVVSPGTSLSAHFVVSGEDALWRIEIISDGDVVWQERSAALDVDLTADLGRAQRDTYYYLRIMQRDGALVYASPVFVHMSDPS